MLIEDNQGGRISLFLFFVLFAILTKEWSESKILRAQEFFPIQKFGAKSFFTKKRQCRDHLKRGEGKDFFIGQNSVCQVHAQVNFELSDLIFPKPALFTVCFLEGKIGRNSPIHEPVPRYQNTGKNVSISTYGEHFTLERTI